MESLNLSNLNVDASGKASFSGLTSGIDFQDVTDKIIAAKRIPAVTLENRITANDEKVAAYKELSASLTTLQNAISKLRGAVSFDQSKDIFKDKQAFASTSRTDGVIPSAAGSLVGVTLTNTAAKGTHEIEIRRIATAHKLSSKSFASTTSAVATSGSFDIFNGTATTTNGPAPERERISAT